MRRIPTARRRRVILVGVAAAVLCRGRLAIVLDTTYGEEIAVGTTGAP